MSGIEPTEDRFYILIQRTLVFGSQKKQIELTYGNNCSRYPSTKLGYSWLHISSLTRPQPIKFEHLKLYTKILIKNLKSSLSNLRRSTVFTKHSVTHKLNIFANFSQKNNETRAAILVANQ